MSTSDGIDRRNLLLAALAAPFIIQTQSAKADGPWWDYVPGESGEERMARMAREDPEFKGFIDAAASASREGIPNGLVRDIAMMVGMDPAFGPTLVRLAWHSSGTYDKVTKTGGSSKGTIRFKEELQHEANGGLAKAIERLEPLKQKYPEVSYADLFTLCGAVAVEALGGPRIVWKAGRVDSKNEKDATPDGRLPDPDKGSPPKTIAHLREIFGRMGFNDQELVALSGAHTLGRCHIEATGYEGPWAEVPIRFDNAYFNLLLLPTAPTAPEKEWKPHTLFGKLQFIDPYGVYMMLPSDMALLEDENLKKYVQIYADSFPKFKEDFGKAYAKLLALGTGQ